MRGEGLLFETEDGRSRFLVRIGMPPVVVGRRPPYAPPNVRVSSVLVSRQHLRVLNGPNGYAIEDAGSTGGVYLEGERLRGVTPVGAGSRIQLGGDTVYVARTFFGESLASMRGLGESGPADLPSTLRMVRDIARALRPLHQAGEAHGNLDPHQLLRSHDDGSWTLLIDGWTVLDPDGELSGNPVYVAPEVFDRQELVTGSDLYALGLCAFEMLFGYRPFDDRDPQTNMMAKLFGGAPDWRKEPEGGVRDFFLRLLALHPHQRPDVTRTVELIYEMRPELRSR